MENASSTRPENIINLRTKNRWIRKRKRQDDIYKRMHKKDIISMEYRAYKSTEYYNGKSKLRSDELARLHREFGHQRWLISPNYLRGIITQKILGSASHMVFDLKKATVLGLVMLNLKIQWGIWCCQWCNKGWYHPGCSWLAIRNLQKAYKCINPCK